MKTEQTWVELLKIYGCQTRAFKENLSSCLYKIINLAQKNKFLFCLLNISNLGPKQLHRPDLNFISLSLGLNNLIQELNLNN